jgi:hypothetical protein
MLPACHGDDMAAGYLHHVILLDGTGMEHSRIYERA